MILESDLLFLNHAVDYHWRIFVRIGDNMGNYFANFFSASGGKAPRPHRGSAPGPR